MLGRVGAWGIAFLLWALAWGAPLGALAADDAPIPAENVTALRKQVGQSVVVVGRIARTGRSSSGMQFLNFADSELTVVCGKEDATKFQPKDPADLFRGLPVTVRGELELYRGKVQIRLRDPEQIETTSISNEGRTDEPAKSKEGTAAANSPEAGFALRETGKDRWISPGGLRYEGRDPEGLTRLEHIARHMEDQPTRDGPHGVFEGGADAVFALIDEAWKLAQTRRVRPVAEGGRSSYTVSMGRRVGYLGGRSGATQGHRPLSRVFIVFETGTKKIITAFPK